MTPVTFPDAGRADRDLLIATVRQFEADRIRPIADDLDATERFPEEICRAMGALGLLGITVPEAQGGSGGSALDYAKVVEELAYGYSSVADQCGLVEVVASLLAAFGTAEQQGKYLPGLLAGTSYCAYAASKHDVIGLMRTLAAELAPRAVRVNAVCPTNVGTPLLHHEEMSRLFSSEDGGRDQEGLRRAFASVNKLPVPWVEPEDVAAAVAWLLSDESRFVTGVALPVDAGAMLY